MIKISISRVKGAILRYMCPIFFKKIGSGASFYGRIRFPLPFRNIVIGDNCMIGDSAFFQTGRNSKIRVGDNCSINTGCHIVASESIYIGNNTAIGEYVSIRDQEHLFNIESGVRGNEYLIDAVVINDNVWIGRGVYIGPGVTIGKGTIVGANSVVLSGVYPPGVLLVGSPAIVKKKLEYLGSGDLK